jgi:hypothetical protein
MKCIKCGRKLNSRMKFTFVGYAPVCDTATGCPKKKKKRRSSQPMNAGCGMSGIQMGN